MATKIYIKHQHELTMDQAEYDVAHSVLSDEQCGIMRAEPAKWLAEGVTENGPVDWVQGNPGVVVAVVLLGGWILQQKRRSARKP